MALTVVNLYRYPLKGLTAEPLGRVDLTPREGLPQDRRFALAHGSTRFDPAAPEFLPKTNFLMLMRNERLARLRTRFDAETGVLTVQRDGKQVASGAVDDVAGRTIIEQFFAAYMGDEARGSPRLVEAPGHMFSDYNRKMVSIIGLASVRDLERVVRNPVDPVRFRANVYFDGGRPWEELDWVDREIRLGNVRLKIAKRIVRCAATNVDPETGKRDLNLPLSLKQNFGHDHMGVYGEVLDAGAIAVSDMITPPQ